MTKQGAFIADLTRRHVVLGDVVFDLLDALETCHNCGVRLATDDMPVSHCESCGCDCDLHEGPECTPVYVLIQRCRKALAA